MMREMIISNRYHVRSCIGQGGMADVYLAYDAILKRDVAVKVLRESLADDPIHVERFKREANAVATISHENIVKIYDVGDEAKRHYIVMEYVPGQTLKDLITVRHGLEQKEAVYIMKQILEGIIAAHKAGIVHRDIKPQNILVTDSGSVKITDFGIASIQNLTQVTNGDTIMGSLHYLAPEIVKGEKACIQSDLYALGIMFYEMLSGSVPFTGDSPVNIAMKHIEQEMPSIRAYNPLVYQSIENIIIKSTAKNIEDRYESASEMLEDLVAYKENKNMPKLVFEREDGSETIVAAKKDLFFSEMSQEEMEKLEKERKRHRNRVILYAALTAILAFIVFIVVYLKLFNAGVEQIKIPKVLGLTEQEAIVLLEENGFTVKEAEPKPSDLYEEGKVCKVYPKEGKKVNVNSEVTITISSGLYIVMKDYVGMDYDEAFNELSTLGYTVNTVYVEDNSKEPNTVIEQSILKDTRINPDQENKTIRLKVVASFSYKMENFLNVDITSAQGVLSQCGLNVHLSVLTPPTDPNEIAAMKINTVIKQSINVGTVITQKGTLVTLYYYDTKPAIKEDDPEDPIVDPVTPTDPEPEQPEAPSTPEDDTNETPEE